MFNVILYDIKIYQSMKKVIIMIISKIVKFSKTNMLLALEYLTNINRLNSVNESI